MLQASTISFLKSLKKNNNKDWFDKNRSSYENAKADFVQLVQQLIDKTAKKDPTLAALIAKNCIFRINRDVRFSNDKSPYKSNMGASINKAGKKAMFSAGYYFHLEPGNSFVGGGIYMPMAPELKKIRQEIDYNWKDFKKILTDKKFKSIYSDLDRSEGIALQRVPKGYEQENPAAEYLKLKSYIVILPISDKELQSKDLIKKTVAAFEALQPLVYFLNQALAD